MPRLNARAYQILQGEIEKFTGNDPLKILEKQLVLEQLQDLRIQEGKPASLAELKKIVITTYPQFSQGVLQEAAKANHSSSTEANLSTNFGNLIKGIFLLMATGLGVTGLVALANLPYPMIRRPVAKVAPILLLPSYMSMDRNYREAIAHVEQADQLINNSTSAADIELGASKVKQAQANLDQLPVWFLGYEPQMSCRFFSCSWRFTYDEFKSARKLIGRMEAQIFQEQNAQTQLVNAEAALTAAQQQYATGNAKEKQQAIAAWQSAIDLMEQIYPNTLAAKIAEPKLTAAQRDFEKISGLSATFERSSNLIEAAKAFGMQAAIMSQNPPHPAAKWEQTAQLWEKAMYQLQQVGVDEPTYPEAQQKLAEYQANLAAVKIRIDAEKQSVTAMKRAKDLIAQWQRFNTEDSSYNSQGAMASTLQQIINELESITAGTTVSAEAQELLKYVQEAKK
jgi:hypothetical protein